MELSIVFGIACLITGSAAADGMNPAPLASWVVGIIAVAVFLVLAFAFLLFNHYVCIKFYDMDEDEDEEDDLEANRVTEDNHETGASTKPTKTEHVYENEAYKKEMVTEL